MKGSFKPFLHYGGEYASVPRRHLRASRQIKEAQASLWWKGANQVTRKEGMVAAITNQK